MPIFAVWMGTLFSGLVGFLAQHVTKKLAITLAVIAGIATLTATFYTAVTAAMVAISFTTPYWITVAMSWVIPPQFTTLVSIYIGANVTAWVYVWQVKIIQYKLI